MGRVRRPTSRLATIHAVAQVTVTPLQWIYLATARSHHRALYSQLAARICAQTISERKGELAKLAVENDRLILESRRFSDADRISPKHVHAAISVG